MGLHCSHYHGRGKWGTRFTVDNAEALCYGCHQHLGSQPELHHAHMLGKIGPGAMDILREKVNDTSLGRIARREVKEIAAFYREEYKRLHQMRMDGHEEKLTVNSWN